MPSKFEALSEGMHVDLPSILEEERRDAAAGAYRARTVLRSPELRLVLLTLGAGARIAEHQAAGTTSVHVLSGQVRLVLEDRTVELGAGQLFGMDKGLRHALEAVTDSAVLLSVGWPPDA